MKAARPPNEATPAMVLAADPPEISISGAHGRVERGGRVGVDEAHMPLGRAVARQEGVVAASDDVDDGVADGDDVVAGLGHGGGLRCMGLKAPAL